MKILTVCCIYNKTTEYAKMIKSLTVTEEASELEKMEFIGIYNENNLRFSSVREAIKWMINRAEEICLFTKILSFCLQAL